MVFEYVEEPWPAPVHQKTSCAGITHFFLGQVYQMVVYASRYLLQTLLWRKWAVMELGGGSICI